MNKRTLLWATLWQNRWLLLKCSAVGLFLGFILVLSLPAEYQTFIFTVPESTVAEIAADQDFSAIATSTMPAGSIQM
ncbi:hypothetical protein LJC29_07920, partial [Bacteroides sp. OttesenSCG-928-N06]|nr:hypothetical protein [Bacteroides sp. OttesenSCG-928-N06]